ncbi:factor H binding protein domain-containing protein [Pasteurella sp. PK-2025]|uniref:factor H binding protein domain-containing protein n=1 Tax=Pasteurella sp. PK-2025 TaxID=3413133 RepID=UPI003C7616E6
MKKLILPIVLSLNLTLTACGGGGSGGNQDNKKDELTTIVKPRNLEKIETINTLILTDGEKFLASYLLAPPSKQAKTQSELKDGNVYIESIEVTLDDKKYTNLELANFNNGLRTNKLNFKGKGKLKGEKLQDFNEDLTLITYKQDSSAVLMLKRDGREWAEFRGIIGESTRADSLPAKGIFTYNGSAFGYKGDKIVRGDLIYKIDLENGIGAGVIKGLIDNDILLHPTSLIELTSKDVKNGTVGFSGRAEEVSKMSGEPVLLGGKGGYEIGIFGKDGKEIAGYTSGESISFGYEDLVIDGKPVGKKDNTAWDAGIAGKIKE